jgi:hypothetical protein
MNGELRPAAETAVSVFNRGLLCGDGVFEGLRLLAGQGLCEILANTEPLLALGLDPARYGSCTAGCSPPGCHPR